MATGVERTETAMELKPKEGHKDTNSGGQCVPGKGNMCKGPETEECWFKAPPARKLI